ncbi:MAG: helix-turn-helix domain-containing protein [Armatimonadetes bacterium]|nr:helix-turn-helix domain-containing protein [Armatimonadota bacterium]
MNAAPLFKALGDPYRLELIERLSDSSPLTITQLIQGFPATRQGMRRHLQVLEEAEIIVLEPHGRDVRVRLNPESIEVGQSYLAAISQRWDAKLQALKAFVESTEG